MASVALSAERERRTENVFLMLLSVSLLHSIVFHMLLRCQHFEQRNVERPIFRNFEISNIKRTKYKLFDYFQNWKNWEIFENYGI